MGIIWPGAEIGEGRVNGYLRRMWSCCRLTFCVDFLVADSRLLRLCPSEYLLSICPFIGPSIRKLKSKSVIGVRLWVLVCVWVRPMGNDSVTQDLLVFLSDLPIPLQPSSTSFHRWLGLISQRWWVDGAGKAEETTRKTHTRSKCPQNLASMHILR